MIENSFQVSLTLFAKYISLCIYNAAGSFLSKANESSYVKMGIHNPECNFKKNESRQKSEFAIDAVRAKKKFKTDTHILIQIKKISGSCFIFLLGNKVTNKLNQQTTLNSLMYLLEVDISSYILLLLFLFKNKRQAKDLQVWV